MDSIFVPITGNISNILGFTAMSSSHKPKLIHQLKLSKGTFILDAYPLHF
jgi:hypothetical protein